MTRLADLMHISVQGVRSPSMKHHCCHFDDLFSRADSLCIDHAWYFTRHRNLVQPARATVTEDNTSWRDRGGGIAAR